MAKLTRNQRLLAYVEEKLTSLAKDPESIVSHELVDTLKARVEIRMMMTGEELSQFDEFYENL